MGKNKTFLQATQESIHNLGTSKETELDRLVAFAFFSGKEAGVKEMSDAASKVFAEQKKRAKSVRYKNMAEQVQGGISYIYHPDYSGDYTKEFGGDEFHGRISSADKTRTLKTEKGVFAAQEEYRGKARKKAHGENQEVMEMANKRDIKAVFKDGNGKGGYAFIEKVPDGKYAVNYGYDRDLKPVSPSSASGYSSYGEAEKHLKQHRPTAKKIKKTMRKLKKNDPAFYKKMGGNAKMFVRKEPSYRNIDMQDFIRQYRKEYNRLYNSKAPVAGYHDAVDRFDVFLKQNPQFVGEFVKGRGDFVSSDREAAAFMFTLDSVEKNQKPKSLKPVEQWKRVKKSPAYTEVVTLNGNGDFRLEYFDKDGRKFGDSVMNVRDMGYGSAKELVADHKKRGQQPFVRSGSLKSRSKKK